MAHGEPRPWTVELRPGDDLLEGEELAYLTTEPAREARTAPFPDDLDPRVAKRSPPRDRRALTHQAEAWEAARAASTSSSRPAPRAGRRSPSTSPSSTRSPRAEARALYLYPTKALAQDQARALDELQRQARPPAIYDGDTESERRWQIRKWSNLILTNPDMLHVGVLPHHDRWGDVLSNLRYVVVDEAHVYRGVFGSHVGNVLRRLRRLARVYGAEPQFLLASATIGNPGELAGVADRARLHRHRRRRRAEGRADDRALEPELLDEELGQRASALADASKLMADLVERGLRTLVFAKSRARPS